MKIAIVDDYQDAFRRTESCAKLAGHTLLVYKDTEKDPEKLAQRLADADIVVLTQQRSKLPRSVICRLPKLKLISQTGRNVSHIDLAACTENGTIVSVAGAGNPHPPAELTWGLILCALRSIPHEVARLRSGHWQSTLGDGLMGKTLGVYALGRIGSLVAKVGRAFEMRVACFGREGSLTRAREAGFDVFESREQLFSESDVLTLHLPLNTETRGVVRGEDLARMKETALLVNTSRAEIIEDGALVSALQRGRPGRAAVDVFEDEPVIGASHPLLSMPNVVCTPHLGYVESETIHAYYSKAVDNILAFFSGAPQNVRNPEAALRR